MMVASSSPGPVLAASAVNARRAWNGGRVLVDGDHAVAVLVDDEVAGGDRLVERVGQFLPLAGLDEQ
jgi:hypothetical protein